MADLFSVAISVVAGFAGALGTGILRRRDRIDKGLLDKRADAYADLWRLTGVLPKYPHNAELTYSDLAKASLALRDWYYDGGLYLSRRSQEHYVAFQKTLIDAVKAGVREPRAGDIVDPLEYEKAQSAGSSLRSSLTEDLFSRTGARWF